MPHHESVSNKNPIAEQSGPLCGAAPGSSVGLWDVLTAFWRGEERAGLECAEGIEAKAAPASPA